MTTEQQIRQFLSKQHDPYLGCDYVAAQAVKSIKILNNVVHLELCFAFPIKNYHDELYQRLNQLCSAEFPGLDFNVTLSSVIEPKVLFSGLKPLKTVKNVIAVASGKGGVGKSTTSVNLAAALQQEGARVGILDADIHGPNQPHMLGAQQKPKISEDKRFEPVVCHGLQSMSIGYLVDNNTPMIWRGPMVSGALQQLFFDTDWQDLDYLIIDLPPGTGDIQLTLSKKIPVTAAIVVTTPQDIALLDARKAYEMFRKVGVPVYGIVENMAMHTCSQCGHQEHIFGEGGAKRMAQECSLPYLGALPLAMSIREQADKGLPLVLADPNSEISLIYHHIARTLAAKLSLQAKDDSVQFQDIMVEHK